MTGATGQAEAPRPEARASEAAEVTEAPEVAEVSDTGPGTGAAVGTGADVAASGAAAASDISSDEPVPAGGDSVDDDTTEGDGLGDTPPESDAPVGPPEVTDFRMALVSAVSVDLPNQHPTVVLRETESPRRQLSFSIGFQDGVVLSHAVRRIGTPRPLTHELLTGILHGFHIDVVAVRLVGRQGAVYFAELDLRGKSGRSVHACRPSDALTIAVLQPVPAPILIDRRLLEESGDVLPR